MVGALSNGVPVSSRSPFRLRLPLFPPLWFSALSTFACAGFLFPFLSSGFNPASCCLLLSCSLLLCRPADVRRAEARLDSGRLVVVVPPLEDLSEYKPSEDAELFPLRIPVDEKPLPWTGLKGFRIYHSRRDWIFNYHKFSQYPRDVDLFSLDVRNAQIRPPDKQEEQEVKRMAETISKKNWRLWRGKKL
ncbi:hypothetical protein TGARI_267790B [Toxoplasma gondii ARI]|uniref:Transmembrane protein n=2 Tax=Toxoplasma gondii TaxID=5811 RepID=A0A139Y3N5_TOXGO|nr:hypothetical protein TGARI_267790B [Toxoplasma gondii ARI]